MQAQHAVATQLCLAAGALLAPGRYASTEGRNVGRRHARFAAFISGKGLSLDSDELKAIGEAIGGLMDCEVDEVTAASFSEEQREILEHIVEDCQRPWMLWFHHALDACDARIPEDDDYRGPSPDLYDELGMDGYYSELLSALKHTHDPLTRTNTFGMMRSGLGAHVMLEMPRDRIDAWFAKATHEYLKTATFGDALAAARDFAATWTGIMPQLGNAFRRFACACEDVSQAERRMLLSIVEP